MNNLATMFNEKGRYKEKENMNRRAVAGRGTASGPAYSDMLMIMSSFALVPQARTSTRRQTGHQMWIT
jgi:hypothetical protein